jgi:peptide/nickel transport system substrate-binding protein
VVRIRVILIVCALLATCFVVPARAENVVRWATLTPAATFDPVGHDIQWTYWVQHQVYERLIDYDKDGALEAKLATSWKRVDATTWELELRHGVAFHDGTLFTSADAVFSFERAKADNSSVSDSLRGIAAIEAVDPDTIRVTVTTSNPIAWDDLSELPIMSKVWAEAHEAALPAQVGDARWDYAETHANGTGPFMLEGFEPGERTVLVRNPNWWGLAQHPHNIDRIVQSRRSGPGRAASLCRRDRPAPVPAGGPARTDRRYAGPESPEGREHSDALPRLRPGEPRAQVLERQGAQSFR